MCPGSRRRNKDSALPPLHVYPVFLETLLLPGLLSCSDAAIVWGNRTETQYVVAFSLPESLRNIWLARKLHKVARAVVCALQNQPPNYIPSRIGYQKN